MKTPSLSFRQPHYFTLRISTSFSSKDRKTPPSRFCPCSTPEDVWKWIAIPVTFCTQFYPPCFFVPSLFTDPVTRMRVTAPGCTKLFKIDSFSMNRKVVQASCCLAFAFRHPCFYWSLFLFPLRVDIWDSPGFSALCDRRWPPQIGCLCSGATVLSLHQLLQHSLPKVKDPSQVC